MDHPLFRSIPRWLVAFAVLAFMLVFVERTYISKQPFKLFGEEFGPIHASPPTTPQATRGEDAEHKAEFRMLQMKVKSLDSYAKKSDLAKVSEGVKSLRSDVSEIELTLGKLGQDHKDFVSSSNATTIQDDSALDADALRGKQIGLFYYNHKAIRALTLKKKLVRLGVNIADFHSASSIDWTNFKRNIIYYSNSSHLEAALQLAKSMPSDFDKTPLFSTNFSGDILVILE